MPEITYRPIGLVRSRVREPRSHGWESLRSDIVLRQELADALDGLDGFSHAIVVFHLSGVPDEERRSMRLQIAGAESGREVGLFATRTPLRPNAVAVSVVRIVRRRRNVLRVLGLDALDGTPVLDIKPYLPTYDSVPDAALPSWAVRDEG
jgi:tRNA (adenine37-N6)-methyltransferase